MKKLLTLLFLLLSLSSYSQGVKDEWHYKMTSGFYSKIKPHSQWDCCEKQKKGKVFVYSFEIPESAYFPGDFSIGRYLEENFDSTLVAKETQNMVDKFNCKFPKKKSAKFNKSCFWAYISYEVQDDVTQYVTFVKGRAQLIFSFQE